MTLSRECNCRCSESWKHTYSQQFDAWFCKSCDTWLTRQCSDKTCEFCKDRPENPSETEVRNEE